MLHAIRSFFSLQTLDTRLQAPTDAKHRQNIVQKATRSRWATAEFRVYLVVFAVVVPYMYLTAMSASNETNPNYPRFAHLLKDGWMFGRKVDNSDPQYRFFRDNFPMLGGLLVMHIGVRRLFSAVGFTNRLYFDSTFGLLFLVAAHGCNAVRVLLHFAVFYLIGRTPNKKASTVLLWVWGVATLFINDNFRAYPFGNIVPALAFLDTGFKGIIERWDVFYNFTLLRLLSFNFDYLERKHYFSNPKSNGESSIGLSLKAADKKKNDDLTRAPLDDRQRLVAPLYLQDYGIVNYLAYLLYTPLYIAGPIITFNDYVYQSRNMLPTINAKRIAVYAARFAFCLLVMEFLLHYMYVVAVSKTKAWDGDTPFQISMLGLFNLNIIWLKLLIPWRLFRLWAMADGIDPPENMIRCMDNNYSALAFWRAWHRSFNRWVIRYIYVPLGGSGNRILTSLTVFSFVAIWHDIELKMLLWGWLVVLFILPELFATIYFKPYANRWWFRHVCAVGAVINIWMMMMANLFGFCLGKDGMVKLLQEMFQTFDGLVFFAVSSACLFVGAQVMFELRESEKRKGIDVRC
ncbi:hypothetical protein BABINDRAFT_163605 [Babjeviella inositovora NRRL Y-12698]|uniref:CHASE domain-containing protein n=1 Tax=Babjeviella inositovora NRRL Y-12698 TaxID=984486 RepID=A0A1E3QIB6_9ASCO|nr:uncharacterized protein BABINDRAFT_163605 [Babjeviella inositovora NRRL Y-12698]ODQ77348.1 hypothetical protein BABINDRAFT_163605 [Babjeviella inositovora NRRL Y-12698]